MMLPFEIRPSPMQGLGAFATRPIPAGVRLIEYAGERLTPTAADARYPDDPGEELAYDYAYTLEERHTPAAKRRFPCHCGAATCRGTILAKKR